MNRKELAGKIAEHLSSVGIKHLNRSTAALIDQVLRIDGQLNEQLEKQDERTEVKRLFPNG